MFENLLYEQNIHWIGRKYNIGVEREILSKIEDLLNIDHIISISGVRRSGKSFLLRQIIHKILTLKVPKRNILVLNLETPDLINYRDDPKILDKIYDEYMNISNPEGRIFVLLDEIQFIKNWEVWVKNKYDTNKGNIKFIITGSNADLLSSELTTLLSGRVIEIKNYPFSFKEFLTSKGINFHSKHEIYLNRHKIKKLFDVYLKNGSMPEISTKTNDYVIKEILANYLYTIIFKDVVPRFSVRDLNTIEKVAIYAITNVSREFSYNRVAKFLNSSDTTVSEYIYYLSRSYLLFELKRISTSLKQQYTSIKKIYCVDTGFPSHIGFKFNEDKGRMLENLVFIELKRRGKEVYYHKGKKECDFIIKENLNIVQAVQVSQTLINEETRKREVSGLVDALKTYNLKEGLILTEDEEDEFEEKGFRIKVMPVWKWLLK